MLDPAFFYHPQPTSIVPEIKIFAWQYMHLDKWEVFHAFRPFWRLYWNPTPGAAVIVDTRTFELTPDVVLLIPPMTNFRIRLAHPVNHFFIHFLPGEGFPRIAEQTTALPCPEIMHRVLESDAPPRQQEIRIYALLFELLADLPEQQIETQNHAIDPRIRKALRLLDDLPPHRLANNTIARAVNMATSSYQHLFKKQIGVSPQKYVLMMRMERARLMLRTSTTPIPEIAAALGFADRYHFSAVFTRYNGTSPAAYRKQSREPRKAEPRMDTNKH